MINYVIWGKPPGNEAETILIEKFDGKYVQCVNDARKLQKILETKYKCTQTRIQEVNTMLEFNFFSPQMLKK